MSAADIARSLGHARREGRGWRCRCPLHGGRSLVLRDGHGGRVLVTCWGGCDRLDVLSELGRCGLLDERTSECKSSATSAPHRYADPEDDARRIAWARQIWDAAQNALGTPVARHLVNRGITMPPPAALRWAPRCWHGGAHQELPAMVGLVEHVERGIVGVHRTYLRSDGGGKAAVMPVKASLGPVGGGAVRFGMPRPGEWLAVAEGIETALAVATACSVPAWAALSAGGIKNLMLPCEATLVTIAADHDTSGTGARAARHAAERWLAEGRRVRIAMPPTPNTDWNDVLLGKAPARITEEVSDVT